MMVKWMLDRLFALAGIILLAPLGVVLSVYIKCKDGGDVFFSQNRVGKNGAIFKIRKFRTMAMGSSGSSVTVSGESRITPWGAFLRRYKLDELPQLWNVLIGEMSFVGPRPDVPGFADKLEGDDRDILRMRPGITGLASLKYRNEEVLLSSVSDPIKYNETVIFPDKVRINLIYYRQYSLLMDFNIIFATLFNRNLECDGEIF